MGDGFPLLHPKYDFPLYLARQSSPLCTHISLEPLSPCQVSPGSKALLHSSSSDPAVPAKDTEAQASAQSKTGNTLKLFKRLNTRHKNLSPKLENIRYRVLRTLKKALRRIYTKKDIKPKGLMGVDLASELVAKQWLSFQGFAMDFRCALEPFSQLKNGPKVDQARSPRTNTSFTTYNNAYISSIFQVAEVRKVYQLFVQVLFAESSCESLKHRFGMVCCTSGLHWSVCEEKWKAFRDLLEGYLGANITH